MQNEGCSNVFSEHAERKGSRGNLKKHGFIWVPGERCWQSNRRETSGYYAREAVNRGVGE